ncbi:hypothetical protein ACF07M_20360 [Streptomyces globisporus]|uniref:hypothetical protein n=1 Tax=Streptomyces globisporus TaxID=1908 RepID=UPI0036FA855A
MNPTRRQLTACPRPATRITRRHNSTRTLQWVLYVCETHRSLAPQLAGSTHLNHKTTRHVEQPAPRCGTLYDEQRIEQAIDSYGRLNPWIGGVGGWVESLREAATFAAHLREADADDLERVAQLAESGPEDPTVQAWVLKELARVEAARTEKRNVT